MKCLQCQSEAVARGLCSPCFAAANRQVKRGTVSWDALEEQGKVSPLLDPRRPRRGSRKHNFVG